MANFQTGNEGHFRVVRYYHHFGHGILADVLGENLNFDEARQILEENEPIIEDEHVVVEDQNKQGAEAEVLVSRRN